LARRLNLETCEEKLIRRFAKDKRRHSKDGRNGAHGGQEGQELHLRYFSITYLQHGIIEREC
jgi:hypothetical protein